MLRTLLNAMRDPARYSMLALKRCQQPLSRLFPRTAFFMQAQMDINPRSRCYARPLIARTGGFFIRGDRIERRIVELEPWDVVRRDMLILLLRTINERKVPGEMAELGVYRGATARLIHQYMPDRDLHLFDTFSGFDDRDRQTERRRDPGRLFADTSVQSVLKHIAPMNERVHIHEGFFPDSIPADLADHTFAFVHLDCDLYEPTLAGLRYFYPRLPSGGILVCHDYNSWEGARSAVDEFFRDKPEIPIPMPDKNGSALIVKR
jgi:O-methyltransferase